MAKFSSALAQHDTVARLSHEAQEWKVEAEKECPGWQWEKKWSLEAKSNTDSCGFV